MTEFTIGYYEVKSECPREAVIEAYKGTQGRFDSATRNRQQ